MMFLFQRKVTQASERDLKYQTIMRNLVRRYVTQVLVVIMMTRLMVKCGDSDTDTDADADAEYYNWQLFF